MYKLILHWFKGLCLYFTIMQIIVTIILCVLFKTVNPLEPLISFSVFWSLGYFFLYLFFNYLIKKL